MAAQKQKLKIKDILTVVLLSLINIVIFGFGTFFYLSPFTVLLMPVFYSVFQGIVFFMLGVKVPKGGAMIIYCVIMGLIGFNLVYIASFVVAGIIIELILHKTGYTSAKGLSVSYVLMQLSAAFGSTIYPYGIALESTIKNMGDNLNQNVIDAAKMIESWGVIVLIALVLVSAIIGAVIGWAATKKHLLKAEN